VHGLDVVADAALVRRVIGFAGQFAAVDPNLTGRENLTLIGRLSRVGRKQAKIRAAELLFPRPERSPHGDPDHRRHRGAGMNTLDGQVALVTGSSRGIGAAIAAEFARRGAAVAVHGRDQAAAAAVAAGIARDGGKVITVIGDVTEFGHVESVRRQVEDGLGPVDILVANAGGSFTPPAPLEEIPEDGWRATVDGNLLATFLTMKSFLPGMKDRGRGVIITISSAAGRRPHPQSPIPYAAAKAGIALLTQDVAAQAGPFGIRVNCIAPETILTERNRERIPSESQATMADRHPLKRLGTPEDVANTAAFLASAEAAWLTGLVVDVAGGAVMV
jgi:3-oxoacyl-[acyl-carrier protein] reductase